MEIHILADGTNYKLDILRNNKLIERLINSTVLNQNLIIELPKSIDDFDLIFF